MGSTLWPVNGTFSGRMLRQMIGAWLSGKSPTRPFGSDSGVYAGTSTGIVTATTSTWTVTAHGGAMDDEASGVAGPYNYGFDTTQTGAMTAPHATLDRIDLLSITSTDVSEGDPSTTGPTIVKTVGTANASPVAPATPANNFPLAQMRVPALGTGSPVVTWVAPWVVALGAIKPVSGASQYPASPYLDQYIGDAVLGLLRWNGSAWVQPAATQQVTDWNTAVATGFYWGNAAASNSPTAAIYAGMVLSYPTGVVMQRAWLSSATPGNWTEFQRFFDGSTWGNWVQVAALPQVGSTASTILTGNNSITGTTSFGRTYLSAPKVIPIVTASGGIGVAISATTTTGFSWRAFATSGSNVGVNTSAPFDWAVFGR